MNQSQRINSGFVAIISVFFFWGFVAASNSILIPLFKANFGLSQFQSQLVDFAFYLAYFVGSLVYFILSESFGDPLSKLGYKKGLIMGLLLSSVGALMFFPAANTNSYFFLLCAQFVIGLGFSIQQIVANPFVVNFGDKKLGAHRLSFAGGINSLGTTIGPVLLSLALFGKIEEFKPEALGIESIKFPALILFGLLILCAALIYFSKMPNVSSEQVYTKDFRLTDHPNLMLGMLAIFIYVGVEVTIQSNLGQLIKLKEIKGFDLDKLAPYISLYWGSLMIGRWTGAITAFNMKKTTRMILQIAIPLVAFAVVYLVNILYHYDTSDFIYYLPYVFLATFLFLISGENAARTLFILGTCATTLMLVGLFTSGTLALLSFISGGLFCSVMWPCIFSLSIRGLGKYTNQGSSLLIMMILGGAIIPPLQGLMSDNYGIHFSYWIPVVCFAYLAWFGFKMRKSQSDNETNSNNTEAVSH